MKTNYQTIDKNGNIWNVNSATGEQTMIHSESKEAAAGSRADIKAFIASRKAAAMQLESIFGK